MKPLVFIDIDGVLNSHDWYARRTAETKPSSLFRLDDLDPVACARLQNVCMATEAELVVTSTWRKIRTLDEIHQLFSLKGLTIPVIGRTPDLGGSHRQFIERWSDIGRGLEIQWWLQHYLPSDEAVCAQRFAILDDERDMGDLLGKLVQTRIATGLTDLELDYVYKHLREPLIGSMAAGGKGRVVFKYDAKTLAPWWNQQEGPFGPEVQFDGTPTSGS